MTKAYKFRLYPNKEQNRMLFQNLNGCRFVYNKLLEELNKQEKIDKGKIQHKVYDLRKEINWLRECISKSQYYENYKLFSSLRGLSNSKKKGNKVGRLKFKNRDGCNSFDINYSCQKNPLIVNDKRYSRIKLPKIGKIKIRQTKEIKGNIKHITIKKNIKSWDVILITDEEYTQVGGTKCIGIDMGVNSFLTTSENWKIENPLYFKQGMEEIGKLQKKLLKCKIGSNNRKKVKRMLNIKWEHIKNQRKYFLHNVTKRLVNNYGFIAVENLNIKKMTKKTKKNKYYNMRNILDSCWGEFLSILETKSKAANIEFVKVNPAYTSRYCSNCGNYKEMTLSDRWYDCPSCGICIGRDFNAAINILGRGKGITSVESEVTNSMKQEVKQGVKV